MTGRNYIQQQRYDELSYRIAQQENRLEAMRLVFPEHHFRVQDVLTYIAQLEVERG